MASYKATKKQWGYFRSLTGESLPSGCSMSEASRLIKKALAGQYTKKRDTVRVFALRFTGTQAGGPLRYTYEVNYMPGPQFDTFAEAERVALAKYGHDANADVIVERDAVREVYCD